MADHRRWQGAARMCWVLAVVAPLGCAHHRADQYSYAPPYAPPVYPQPQSGAVPVNYSAPVVSVPATGIPASAVPAGGLPPGAVVAGAPVGGMVVPAGGDPCAPCSPQGMDGVVVGSAPMIEGGGQTPPCPPGP